MSRRFFLTVVALLSSPSAISFVGFFFTLFLLPRVLFSLSPFSLPLLFGCLAAYFSLCECVHVHGISVRSVTSPPPPSLPTPSFVGPPPPVLCFFYWFGVDNRCLLPPSPSSSPFFECVAPLNGVFSFPSFFLFVRLLLSCTSVLVSRCLLRRSLSLTHGRTSTPDTCSIFSACWFRAPLFLVLSLGLFLFFFVCVCRSSRRGGEKNKQQQQTKKKQNDDEQQQHRENRPRMKHALHPPVALLLRGGAEYVCVCVCMKCLCV